MVDKFLPEIIDDVLKVLEGVEVVRTPLESIRDHSQK